MKNVKPILVIMAAGMGSRYGGLKQVESIDEQGHKIIDFSIYDAIRAGFGKVLFVIKRENEQLFRESIGDRVSGKIPVEYAFQELNDLPEGFEVPEERKKPWGTGHAVRACRALIDAPFAVINADDYYGPGAFQLIGDFLRESSEDEKMHFAMAGYILRNTLTENGHVARGVCEVGSDGFLTGITERTKIVRKDDEAAWWNEDTQDWVDISGDRMVSMNMWGFTPAFVEQLDRRFTAFLEKSLPVNPVGCEYYLPSVVNELLEEGLADVRVLPCRERWYGVTYREDKEQVVYAIRKLKEEGKYPQDF